MTEQLSQERFHALPSCVSNHYEDLIPDSDLSDMDNSQPFAAALSNENEVMISETSCESDEDSQSDRVRTPGHGDDFVEETEPSESYSSQPNRSQSEFAANNDDEINIPATPSESDPEQELSGHTGGFENDSHRIVSSTVLDSTLRNSNEISIPHSNLVDANLSPIYNGINDENEIGESDGSQRSLNQFVIGTEISIPETPSQSESEQDIESNQSQRISQISNISQHSHQNAPAAFSITISQLEDDVVNVVANSIELNDEPRRHAISPDIFDESDDIIPNSINIAESFAGRTPPAIVSPDMFEDDPIDEPYGSPNANEVSPIYDDFPFIVPDVPPNDQNLVSPVIALSSQESDGEAEQNDEDDDDDDDRTILRGENEPIQISARSRAIIERIEQFVAGVVNDLQNGQRIQITVQNRTDWTNCIVENERFSLLPIPDARCRRIKSTFSLSIIFYMLSEIHEMLLTNTKCTLRELYYKNVNVTQKQENVNEGLKTICCLLDASPWELGVLSTSKGLIAGPLQIHLPDDVVIDCGIDRNGILLPHLTSGITDLRTTATYVLVVEKDTVFKKLLQHNVLDRWRNACILITGKGYPDTNTRLILAKLRELHTLPILVFTDADPYGIEIMLTYRHGSLAMSNLAEALAVPSARWLGIFPSDIRKFGIQSMALTAEDNRKLDNILNRPLINDHVHRELLIMKQANVKAEIEGISNSSCAYLIDVYLRNKIDNNDGI